MHEYLCPLLQKEASLELTESLQHLAKILEIVRVEEQILAPDPSGRGRPQIDRRPLARAFVAKSVLHLPDTRHLWEQLRQNAALRLLCGMQAVPSEATFSRAFRAFAHQDLGGKTHTALVERFVADAVVMHVSHDSTAVEAREKATKKEKQALIMAADEGEKKAGSPAQGRNSCRKITKVAHPFGASSHDDCRGLLGRVADDL